MRTRLEIKRIELFSLFKIAFFVYAAIGLVVGIFYGFFLLAGTMLGNAYLDEGLPELGLFGGVLGLVLIPVIAVFYGALGSVFVTIIGFLYNVFAGFAGGVCLETDAEVAQVRTPAAVEDSPPTL